MVALPLPVMRLVRELSKLPSIGDRSAHRLAYHLMNGDRSSARALADAIRAAADGVRFCDECFFLSEASLCGVCTDPSRDTSVICVVEKPTDLLAIERMSEYRGLYHVLHGVWSPLRGKGPESMKLAELLARLDRGGVGEVILATSSTVEGDATSLYVARHLAERGISATRLAQGMPKGGELEYADDVTLSRAFSGRSVVR